MKERVLVSGRTVRMAAGGAAGTIRAALAMAVGTSGAARVRAAAVGEAIRRHAVAMTDDISEDPMGQAERMVAGKRSVRSRHHRRGEPRQPRCGERKAPIC